VLGARDDKKARRSFARTARFFATRILYFGLAAGDDLGPGGVGFFGAAAPLRPRSARIFWRSSKAF